MKILFATIHPIADYETATGISTNISIDAVKRVFGETRVEICAFYPETAPSFWKRQFQHIFLDVKKRTLLDQADIIFLDTSLLGETAKYVKLNHPKKIVITHFHNIEFFYFKLIHLDERNFFLRCLKKIRNFLFYVREVLKIERYAITYSDGLIFLTERNKRDAIKLYGSIGKHIVLPVARTDKFDRRKLEEKLESNFGTEEILLLFVGSNVSPNVLGIRWFIRNVMPFTNAKLQIVGSNMEAYKNEWQSKKIEVVGTVEETSSYYYAADAFVSPLLKGEGMKLKISDALMYGKTIFGTKESFEGYEMDYDKVGALCDNAEAFIQAINNFSKKRENQKFNPYSREVFEKRHTKEMRVENISVFLREIIEERSVSRDV